MTISAEDFEHLLTWLHPDRYQAGEKYETIRRRLIKMFSWGQALDPEDLADETIDRVTRRVEEIRESYEGDPSLYFYAVARNVLLEARRKSRPPFQQSDLAAAERGDEESRERLYDCLEKCMKTLPAANRELLVTYYEGSKRAKIDTRHNLAAQLGLRPSTLRMRVHRIKSTLETCIQDCLESDNSPNNT